jgi:Proteins of 100 residues with WXG.
MGRNIHLNYDELGTIVKKFRNEGEDIVQMNLKMRDRVHNLHKDWVGEGADKFFNEMENDVLPALSRLAGALFYAQDVLHKIIKTIQTFDEDTAGYFKVDLRTYIRSIWAHSWRVQERVLGSAIWPGPDLEIPWAGQASHCQIHKQAPARPAVVIRPQEQVDKHKPLALVRAATEE